MPRKGAPANPVMRDPLDELEILNVRTTLVIDDDVLTVAKAIAEQQHTTVGRVLSDLARRAMHRPEAPVSRNGFPLLPVSDRQAVVTLETVNALGGELQ